MCVAKICYIIVILLSLEISVAVQRLFKPCQWATPTSMFSVPCVAGTRFLTLSYIVHIKFLKGLQHKDNSLTSWFCSTNDLLTIRKTYLIFLNFPSYDSTFLSISIYSWSGMIKFWNIPWMSCCLYSQYNSIFASACILVLILSLHAFSFWIQCEDLTLDRHGFILGSVNWGNDTSTQVKKF